MGSPVVPAVSEALGDSPLTVYTDVNTQTYRWPYPPVYFLWIAATQGVTAIAGFDFFKVIRLAPIAADIALAWLVQWWLGMRGATPRTRLASAAAIALAPIFIGVSSFHGQLDAVAILPAVAALMCWQQLPQGRRALPAGLLIGLGIGLKTVPGLMLLALLPTACDNRERAVLTACAVGVPLLALAPFLVADYGGVTSALQYRGVPGLGGMSLAIQPDLALGWLGGNFVSLSPVSRALKDHGTILLIVALGPIMALLLARKVRPEAAAVIVVLTLYVFGGNFFLQYLVWGLPLLIVLGHWRAAALAQVVLLPATILTYQKNTADELVWVAYIVPILGLFAACAMALALALWRTGPVPRTAS